MTIDQIKQEAIAAKAEGNVVVMSAAKLLEMCDRIEQQDTQLARMGEALTKANSRIEQLERELKTEHCLSFRDQVARLERENVELRTALEAALKQNEGADMTKQIDELMREIDQVLYIDTTDEWDALRKLLEAALKPGSEPVISGAVFDFAGFLTTREAVIKVGATANAAPIAELVKEWCQLRKLSFDDAMVKNWQNFIDAPPAQTPPPRLTDEQIDAIWPSPEGTNSIRALARAIESAVRKQAGWE